MGAYFKTKNVREVIHGVCVCVCVYFEVVEAESIDNMADCHLSEGRLKMLQM
jgi:hypothetical protein